MGKTLVSQFNLNIGKKLLNTRRTLKSFSNFKPKKRQYGIFVCLHRIIINANHFLQYLPLR